MESVLTLFVPVLLFSCEAIDWNDLRGIVFGTILGTILGTSLVQFWVQFWVYSF